MIKSLRNAPPAVAITGMGMVTSLGLDVETSCAAARAGIVRAAEIECYTITSPEDGSFQRLIGHPVRLLTEGFEGQTKLLRLAQAGLSDLQRRTSRTFSSRTGVAFYLSLPDPRRVYEGSDLIPDEEDRRIMVEEAKESDEDPPDPNWAMRMLQEAALLGGWPGEPILRFVATSGYTGIGEAMVKAVLDVASGEVDAAVVGGVDSLLDEETLTWLELTGRLKTPEIAAGLSPGEGAAFFLLEPVQRGQVRELAMGIIRDLCLKSEPGTLLSGAVASGVGLADAVGGIAGSAGWEKGDPIWIITDQNGEAYRAMEWGNATMRLAVRSDVFSNPILWYPAASFGDTGAAAGAIAVCMAMTAFGRGYAPARTAVLLASSDGPSRSGIMLTAPHTD